MDEIVEAEGHLIDSQLLNAMFDTVVRHDAAFEVLEFRIGRTNDEPSFVSMRVTSPDQAGLTGVLEELVGAGMPRRGGEDAHVTPADRDGCAPEDFYSTTNHRTSVRLRGEWLPVEQQRMDAVIVDRRTGARSAASCATSAPATPSSAASMASRSFPSSRSAIASDSRSCPTKSRPSGAWKSASRRSPP